VKSLMHGPAAAPGVDLPRGEHIDADGWGHAVGGDLSDAGAEPHLETPLAEHAHSELVCLGHGCARMAV
jgi:hypothetical protein